MRRCSGGSHRCEIEIRPKNIPTQNLHSHKKFARLWQNKLKKESVRER